MPQYMTHKTVIAAPDFGQDRVCIIKTTKGLVMALADGAGGTGGGDYAAEYLIAATQTVCLRNSHKRDSKFWTSFLASIDRFLFEVPEGGKTTSVIIEIDQENIFGASVGDSGAWLIHDNKLEDLTIHQQSKPLIGSGAALPTPIIAEKLTGTLLMASDGLFKYGSPSNIIRTSQIDDLEKAATQLVDSVRLQSGKLQDDIGIILCRKLP